MNRKLLVGMLALCASWGVTAAAQFERVPSSSVPRVQFFAAYDPAAGVLVLEEFEERLTVKEIVEAGSPPGVPDPNGVTFRRIVETTEVAHRRSHPLKSVRVQTLQGKERNLDEALKSLEPKQPVLVIRAGTTLKPALQKLYSPDAVVIEISSESLQFERVAPKLSPRELTLPINPAQAYEPARPQPAPPPPYDPDRPRLTAPPPQFDKFDEPVRPAIPQR